MDKENVYTYAMEYYPDIKRKKILSFAETCTALDTDIHSEVNQKQRNKYHTLIQKWGIQKSGIDDLIHKAVIETQCTFKKCMYTKGEGWSGMNWEIGINIYIYYNV